MSDQALMGPEGIEPATLGLRVRINKLKRAASKRKLLYLPPFCLATSCSEMQPTETSLDANPYAPLSARETTDTAYPAASAAQSLPIGGRGQHGGRGCAQVQGLQIGRCSAATS